MKTLLRFMRGSNRAGANAGFTGRLSTLGLVNGDALLIRAGERWINDLSVSPSLGLMTLAGVLVADTTKSTELRVSGIDGRSTGGYLTGTQAAPLSSAFTHNLIVNGAVPAGRILGPSHDGSNVSYGTPNDGGGLARGIVLADGCCFEVFGVVPAVTNTTLYDTHAVVGDTSIRIAGAAYWKAGWKFTFGMSKLLQSLAQADCTEVYTVSTDTVPDASGLFTTVMLTTAVTYGRWGKLQYATGAGMSLTSDGYTAANLLGHVPAYMDAAGRGAMASAITAAIAAGRPNVLDQRAPISLLTRNVTISAPNDAAFSGIERFGVHVMKMGLTGSMMVDGVEVFNCGQGGALGRYPIHWHLNSVTSATGALLGLVDGAKNFITNSSIHGSKNRGITFHGVHGARAVRNNIHDILGHAIFLEDGAEESNVIDGNWVTKWRDPGIGATAAAPRGYRIKLHDEKTTGLWVTNARNYIRNNRMSDGHTGRWIVSGLRCFGPSSLVNIKPSYRNVLEWDNNTVHSCAFQGARVFGDVLDEQGNVNLAHGLTPTIDGTEVNFLSQLTKTFFTRDKMWKNNGTDSASDVSGNSGVGNYDNRVQRPNYSFFTMADCLGADFSGATNASPVDQTAANILFVARSLNVEAKQNASQLARNGFASYHGSLPFHDNTFIGYVAGHIATGPDHYGVIGADGASETWDLYINPIETLNIANSGNHYIDSLPGWRAPGPGWVRNTTMYSAYMLAGAVGAGIGDTRLSMAVLDWDGTFGGLGRPKSFMIFNHPFLTTGISDLYVPDEMGVPSFQRVTQTPMYGVEPWAYAGLSTTAYPHASNPYVNQPFGASPVYAGGIDYYRVDPVTFADVVGANCTVGLRRNILSGQHFTIPRGGCWRMSTAAYNEQGNSGAATLIGIDLSLMMRNVGNGWAADDYGIVGVDWPAASTPSAVRMVKGSQSLSFRTGATAEAFGDQNDFHDVGSKAALLALTGSNTGYWRDTVNNRLWMRYAYGNVLQAKPDTVDNWNYNNSIFSLTVVP